MRQQTSAKKSGRSQIIALEEPESHLHPGAIHGLRGVLGELAEGHQLVITTHCPLFVDRARPGSTIIVKENIAKAAHVIEEIRSTLGVRAADNLRSAEWALCVEGMDDATSLRRVLADLSPTIRLALDSNKLAIDVLGGASKLVYKLSLLRDAMCSYVVFVDDDRSGRDAVAAATSAGLLHGSQFSLTICAGLREAEFEDLLDSHKYRDLLLAAHGVDVRCEQMRKANKKWSERIAAAFRAQGKPWDDTVKALVKRQVAEHVERHGTEILHQDRRGVVDSLVRILEMRIVERGERNWY